ncbi:MAG: hypothetical protein ABMA64_34815 [Myxococcota bacterium]
MKFRAESAESAGMRHGELSGHQDACFGVYTKRMRWVGSLRNASRECLFARWPDLCLVGAHRPRA